MENIFLFVCFLLLSFASVQGAPPPSPSALFQVGTFSDFTSRYEIERSDVDRESPGKILLAHRRNDISNKSVLKGTGSSGLSMEIQCSLFLRHPNIVQILELYEDEKGKDQTIMVMEYAPGVDLASYLSGKSLLDEVQARSIIRQVISALAYCHKNYISHHDLSLSNILLDVNTGIVKLLDFGESRPFGPELALLRHFRGTRGYAAPEMIRAEPHDGFKTDIYALGVVIYLLTHGEFPFTVDSPEMMLAEQKLGPAFFMSETSSPELRDLLDKMLAFKATERFSIDQVMSHPWINEGYDKIPENHIPARPIRIQNPDLNVIAVMQKVYDGFEPTKFLESLLSGSNQCMIGYQLVKEALPQLEDTKTEDTHENISIEDLSLDDCTSSYYNAQSSFSNIDF